MRTLFLKILVWFWLAMAAVVVALIVISVITTNPESRWRRPMTGRRIMMFSRAAAAVYEREGRAALAEFIASAEGPSRSNLFFFDDQGEEVAGQEAPPPIRERALQALQRGDEEQRIEPFRPGRPRAPGPIAYVVRSPLGQRYVLVTRLEPEGFPRGRPGPLFFWMRLLGIREVETHTLVLRAMAVLAVAGLVCYGLARYLTAPLVHLRQATRRLASGDLKARVGDQHGRRQDELADLGRDFDLMAERIESMVAAQRRLLSDISHELRSPLARINLAVALIRQRQQPSEDAELDRIELEARRLDTLIGQVLTLARMESNGEERLRQPLELDSLVRRVADDANFEAQNSNRSVRITSSEPVTVEGNEELLRSAVENIVRNAVRYTRPETEVLISLSQVREGTQTLASLRVRDHGDGVPESQLGHLFRPFYRVAEARERESGGVGLGLAIAEQAVKWHRGTIRACNAPEGGLLVEVQLPASAPASAAEERQSSSPRD
ncbi:MAG: ATP-binding protein [Acidobacteriota bacterium]